MLKRILGFHKYPTLKLLSCYNQRISLTPWLISTLYQNVFYVFIIDKRRLFYHNIWEIIWLAKTGKERETFWRSRLLTYINDVWCMIFSYVHLQFHQINLLLAPVSLFATYQIGWFVVTVLWYHYNIIESSRKYIFYSTGNFSILFFN